MSKPPYDKPRPSIPAATARLVLVEAGHACSVKACREHTYLELHHIDENRENNDPANLIALCDKHHKMAHRGVIDRKALRLYKQSLSTSREADIVARLTRLEDQMGADRAELPVAETSPEQPIDASIRKYAASRFAAQAFALCQVAITRYEQATGIYFERHVELAAGQKKLVLDGLKQFPDDREDVIVDFSYIRKAYLDAPAYGNWLRQKIELYEVMTGREARGVLLIVVGRDNLLEQHAIPAIRQSAIDNSLTLQLYSCGELGFHPGPVTAGLL